MVRLEQNLIVSSNPANGSINLSTIGSSFEIQTTQPFKIPSKARNVQLMVPEAEAWWTIPNIEVGINDLFRVVDTNSGSAPSGTAFSTTIIVPPGLYDYQGYNSAVARAIVAAGGVNGIITITADVYTQKILIVCNYTGLTIDFTIAQTARDILGFASATYGPSTYASETFTAPNVAQFNQINYLLIHTDMVSKGIPINFTYKNIIAKILIDVKPGSQILHRPYNPSKINVDYLKNSQRLNYRFWLTDDQGRLVNTSGEYWSLKIVISYLID